MAAEAARIERERDPGCERELADLELRAGGPDFVEPRRDLVGRRGAHAGIVEGRSLAREHHALAPAEPHVHVDGGAAADGVLLLNREREHLAKPRGGAGVLDRHVGARLQLESMQRHLEAERSPSTEVASGRTEVSSTSRVARYSAIARSTSWRAGESMVATYLGYRHRPMSTAVKTNTTELGDSRVRVEVEVASEALERELETAATAIGREMRVPGFRSGKIPPQVVIRQVGREAVLDEAVRRGLPSWYEQAINDAGLTTVGDPSIDLSDLPEKGSPLAFSIEIGIVPPARLGDYRGLDVPKPDTAADADEVQAELDRLRESHRVARQRGARRGRR